MLPFSGSWRRNLLVLKLTAVRNGSGIEGVDFTALVIACETASGAL